MAPLLNCRKATRMTKMSNNGDWGVLTGHFVLNVIETQLILALPKDRESLSPIPPKALISS
jgi:hypothetical protein